MRPHISLAIVLLLLILGSLACSVLSHTGTYTVDECTSQRSLCVSKCEDELCVRSCITKFRICVGDLDVLLPGAPYQRKGQGKL